MTIILFILIFGAVVLSHEFGHFLIAKKNNIHVVEFSVGMGPTILHFTKGETKYSLKLLPLGGACMFEGMDEISGKDDDNIEFAPPEEGSFLAANLWARIATIFAGPFFNLLLGFLVSMIIVGFTGTDRPIIQKINEGSAAEESGLQAGDEIVKINHNTIHLYREVSLEAALNDGEPMTIVYKRDGQKNSITLTPKYSEEDDRYYIGLMGAGEYASCNAVQIVQYGFYETQYCVEATLKSLSLLVRGKLSSKDVSGPVGIANYVGETYEEAKPYGALTVILTMLNFTAVLSVNLGIMNLLPLPALDGGRLVFLLVELVRGKPVPPEKEGMVHFIGLVALLLLAAVVFFNDISNLIH